MKQLLALGLFLLISGTSALAQNSVAAGVKIGANYASIVGDGVRNNDFFNRRIAMHGGIVVDFGFNRFISLKPEILYSVKGFEYDDTSFESDLYTFHYSGKESFHYVDIPVLLNVKADKVFFEIGPQFSLLLLRDREVTENRTYANGLVHHESTDTESENGLHHFDYGFAAGVGYIFQSNFTAGLRYNLSLRPVQEDDNTRNYQFPSDAKHSVLQLSIGYIFF